jgi:hypothetical protein
LGRDSCARAQRRDFAVLGKLNGAPNAGAYMEINHNQLLVSEESVALNASGWFDFHKTYPIFEPNSVMVFHSPPSEIGCEDDYVCSAGLNDATNGKGERTHQLFMAGHRSFDRETC